ncbi:hypothetical protein GCM10022215_05530 [Nocardioides fonticola]|uniref:Uncharacterized protein n=1 Tax=Nocardioides fonticola TaxID=450363 RepID=A0ABP7XBG0_9ACTN
MLNVPDPDTSFDSTTVVAPVHVEVVCCRLAKVVAGTVAATTGCVGETPHATARTKPPISGRRHRDALPARTEGRFERGADRMGRVLHCWATGEGGATQDHRS